jgi:ribosome-associated heat shock protein Hsp15
LTSAREHSATLAPQRLDKWLWFARIVKSRTLAAQLVQDGKVRINRAKVAKPAQAVRANDVLTIVIRGSVHVLRVVAPGARRGPPAEARLLYELLSPPIGAGREGRNLAEPASSAGLAMVRHRRRRGRLGDHE